MSDRYFGTFYLIPPDAPIDDEVADLYVVRTYRHGPSHLRVAEELLRLLGEGERARRIDDAIGRAFSRDERVLDAKDIADVLEAIDGLEARLTAAFLDHDGRIRAEHLDYLREHSRFLELEPDNPLAPLALFNTFGRIASLAVALQDARDHGLDIALD